MPPNCRVPASYSIETKYKLNNTWHGYDKNDNYRASIYKKFSLDMFVAVLVEKSWLMALFHMKIKCACCMQLLYFMTL